MEKKDLCDFVFEKIRDFYCSEKRKDMIVGQNYYLNKQDIRRKKGQNNGLSNEKNENAFARTLVDQKCNYLVGNAPTLRTGDPAYQKILAEIFGFTAFGVFYDAVEECINKGVSYIKPYFSGNKIAFKLYKSEEIIPIWADGGEQNIKSFIRVYDVFSGGELKTFASYFQGNDIFNFEYTGGGALFVGREEFVSSDIYEELVSFIPDPIVAFKYNRHMAPLINQIKTLVDDFNLIDSISSDVLIDIPAFIYIVKNYSGENPREILSYLQNYRMILTENDGGVEKLGADIDISQINLKLESLNSRIFHFGRGVDIKEDKLGNTSGEAIAYKYSDLDLDCKQIQRHFITAFNIILGFVNFYIYKATGVNYLGQKVEVIFNKNTLTKTNKVIDGLVKLKGVISNKTLLANLPYVEDVNAELLEIEKEYLLNQDLKEEGDHEKV